MYNIGIKIKPSSQGLGKKDENMYMLVYGLTGEILECESLKDAYHFFIKDSRKAIDNGANYFYAEVCINNHKKYDWIYSREISSEELEEFYSEYDESEEPIVFSFRPFYFFSKEV